MPSRISQMQTQMLNNATTTTQTQIPMNQTPLDKGIENTRQIMQQFGAMQNKEQAISWLLQNNPQFAAVATMAARSGNLQQFAQAYAQQNGYNLQDIINRLNQR